MGSFLSNFSLLSSSDPDIDHDIETHPRSLNLLKFSQTGLYYGPTFLIDQDLGVAEPIPFFEAVEQESQTNFLEETLNGLADMASNENDVSSGIEIKHVKVVEGHVNFVPDGISISLNKEGMWDLKFCMNTTADVLICVNFQAALIGVNEGERVVSYSDLSRVYYEQSSLEGTTAEISVPLNLDEDSLSSTLGSVTSSSKNNKIDDELYYNSSSIYHPIVLEIQAKVAGNMKETLYVSLDLATHNNTIETPEHSNVYELKTVSRSLNLNGVTYNLQDIYGYADKDLQEENGNETNQTIDQTNEAPYNSPDCVICLTDAKNTIVLPCRHMCLCASCAEVLRNQSNNSQHVNLNKCPICRQPFHSLLQIDTSDVNAGDGNATEDKITVVDID